MLCLQTNEEPELERKRLVSGFPFTILYEIQVESSFPRGRYAPTTVAWLLENAFGIERLFATIPDTKYILHLTYGAPLA
jgi:hypothetical protein